MNKKFTLFTLMLLAFVIANATEKPEVVFTGTPWGTMGISGNGRYIAQIKQASAKLIKMTEESTLWIIKI